MDSYDVLFAAVFSCPSRVGSTPAFFCVQKAGLILPAVCLHEVGSFTKGLKLRLSMCCLCITVSSSLNLYKFWGVFFFTILASSLTQHKKASINIREGNDNRV